MQDVPQFAPGARVVIRDEEWLVRNTLPIRTGGAAVRVTGISELVRNHEAIFLTQLDGIQELRPEETQLVPDVSPQYRRTFLYLESLLRRTPPTDDLVYLGQNAAINYAPYQIEPARLALQALRPRILIADGVGLGKTIEAGVLLTELIKRGRGERILVVAIRSMLAQFQQELWTRFAIPLVRLDSVGLQRVRARIPSNKNPFYYYNRVIISVDTLKNDAQYRHFLEQAHWDVIVIDECHNVANTGSQRNRLASLLARTSDSLILTSATPHNGRPESFANLMTMLEPTAIADPTDYTAEEIEGLFVRRFKKDIEDQVSDQFSQREVQLVRIPAGAAEEAFFDQLAGATFHTLDRGWSNDALYRIGLLKGFLSSPSACLQTLDGRLKRIDLRLRKLRGELVSTEEDGEDLDEVEQLPLLAEEGRRPRLMRDLGEDQNSLGELRRLVEAVDAPAFGKLQRLLRLLNELGVDGSDGSPRVIIFSERIATLTFLQEQLMAALGAGADVVRVFHAGLPDTEQTGIVESFGKADSPIRVLLASDVASEGVNLHYYCHLMIHFDIPWSLITLEQRNGRIDRYGQHETPLVYYLLTVSQNETVKGDLRILERLIEKEQEAHKNIGDAATILGLHDAQREEEYITAEVAAGRAPQEIVPDEPEEIDWLRLLIEAAPAAAVSDGRGQLPRLFSDDMQFARTAFDELLSDDKSLLVPEYHASGTWMSLLAPEDLRRRCEFLPQEAIPSDWRFHLTTDRQRVMRAIEEARRKEGEWPREQLFWELHPVMEWLMDRLLVRFSRHEAPVVLTRQLGAHDSIFLWQGILSNGRSQPVIGDWFGVQLTGDRVEDVLTLDDVLLLSGFREGLPNSGAESARAGQMRAALPEALTVARRHMAELRKSRADEERDRLRNDLRALKQWRQASLARIAAQEATAHGALAARLAHQRREIEALSSQRERWLDETVRTVETPYLRLVVVFSGS